MVPVLFVRYLARWLFNDGITFFYSAVLSPPFKGWASRANIRVIVNQPWYGLNLVAALDAVGLLTTEIHLRGGVCAGGGGWIAAGCRGAGNTAA